MMRTRLLVAVLAACLPCLRAEAACADDASLLAMRTRMMVSALACRGTSDYNAMMRRHRASFLAAQRGLASSFSGGGTSAYDAWFTELANQLGLDRAKTGDDYCPGIAKELREASRLRNASALRAMSDRLRVPYPAIDGCR